MSFFELIRQILRTHPEGMTPQQLRDRIKADHPDYYGTESHRRDVEKGHYKDLDHALLAQIYVAASSASNISVDKSQKPIKLTAMPGPADDGTVIDEEIDIEDLENLGTCHPDRHRQRPAVGAPYDIIGLVMKLVAPDHRQTMSAQGMESVVDRDFSR